MEQADFNNGIHSAAEQGLFHKKQGDKELLAQAFKESEKSSDWWRRIGVLAVKKGKILLTGFNSPSSFRLHA